MADLYVDVDALTELARQLEAVKAPGPGRSQGGRPRCCEAVKGRGL